MRRCSMRDGEYPTEYPYYGALHSFRCGRYAERLSDEGDAIELCVRIRR